MAPLKNDKHYIKFAINTLVEISALISNVMSCSCEPKLPMYASFVVITVTGNDGVLTQSQYNVEVLC